MAVKAIAITRGIIYPDGDGTTFTLVVQVAGIESGNAQNFDQEITGLSPTIATITFDQTIKDAVKARLISQYSYTFGLLDSVRLIGALL